jgi:hypothetical protein
MSKQSKTLTTGIIYYSVVSGTQLRGFPETLNYVSGNPRSEMSPVANLTDN